MMKEADQDPALPAPMVMRGHGVVCHVRQWPSQPGTAQLVMYQQTRLPTTEDLRRWLDDLARVGFRRVRTSALAFNASSRVEAVGFTPIQHLALLEHLEPGAAPPPAAPTTRLLVAQHPLASQVDHAAFGPGWSLDPDAIADVRRATPRHRARAAGGVPLHAFAVTGRDSRQGFLQRLAVHPEHQRNGLGTALVLDSLRYLARWRVNRVLVNTPTTNEPALALYEQLGFHRLHDQLRVYERALA
jgi:ribosomal protein S18 acetylase RimI-like enzyme